MAEFNLGSIGSLLSGGGVASIAKRVRVRQEDVKKVLSAGVPAMIAGMKKNVSSKDGEDSLSRALGDHSISDLSDPAKFLKLADLKDGKKILAHVFGDKQDAAVDKISELSGVTKGKTLSILAIAAPLLLVLLGKQQNQQQSSAFSLGGLLGGLLSGGQQSSGGLLGSLFGAQQQQQQQSSGGLLSGLFGGGQQQSSGGLLSGLFGGGQQQQQQQQLEVVSQQQQQQNNGLLDGILNLFR